MPKVKLTKTELKKQKDHLKRYNRYLPTLYIKKHQLQKEIERIRLELNRLDEEYNKLLDEMSSWISLLNEEVELENLIKLKKIETGQDNIAGVDIPVFVDALIDVVSYDLFMYPLWVDSAVDIIRNLLIYRAKRAVLKFQELCLSKELKVTAQRVNLFEKVKIPEANESIRAISIYLGDQQVAAVGWARMAKKKIQSKRVYD